MKSRPPKILPFEAVDPPGSPKMPTGLDAIAAKKWRQLLKLLANSGSVGALNADVLALYCRLCRDVAAILAVLGTGPDRFMAGRQVASLAQGTQGRPRPVGALSTELGLSPVSRTRLKAKLASHSPIKARNRMEGPPPPSGAIGRHACCRSSLVALFALPGSLAKPVGTGTQSFALPII